MPRVRREASGASGAGLVQVRGFDERNFAELPIILGQKSINSDIRKLERRIVTTGGQTISMVLKAQDKGLPHGLDNDIWLAIQQLFREQGSPESGLVKFTGHALLSKVGLSRNGTYYEILLDSLARLRETTCEITSGYYSVTSVAEMAVSFSPLSTVERKYLREGAEERARFEVTLNKFTIASIRGEYVKPLDLERCQSFQQPLTRVLYRLLDAKLYRLRETAANSGRPFPNPEFVENLQMWGALCGLLDTTPSKIRRALTPPHVDLVAQGYLKAVEYVGRGEAQTVHYVFCNPEEDDQHLVSRIVAHGLTVSEARLWIGRLGYRVDAVLSRLKERQGNGRERIENVPAYLKTILKREEELMLQERELADDDLITSVAMPKSAPVTPSLKRPTSKATLDLESEVPRLDEPLERRVKITINILRNYSLLKHFTPAEQARLERRMLTGTVNPTEVSRVATTGITDRIGSPDLARQLIERFAQE